MTTPRTALEECLRLAEMATPGEWECSEHDFPLPPFEGALEAEWGIYPPLGEAGPVAITAGEYNARAITAAVNILRTHSKALSEALGGWLPIETAPKDGSSVILSDGHTVGEGFWNDGAHCHGHRGGAGFFWESDRGNLLIADNAYATHWRPLPPPPTSSKGSGVEA